MRRRLGSALIGLCLLTPTSLLAQGVTTAALAGRVLDEAGAPVAGVRVELQRPETGAIAATVTDDAGRFYLPNLRPGGPYLIVASRIGFAPSTREAIQLRVGQTLQAEITLSSQAVAVDEISVRLEQDPVFDISSMGISTRIDAPTLERVPTISRNFLELARLSPLAKVDEDGVSIGGSSLRLNSIQIDGALNQDAFGLSPSGVAGGQARGRLIPLEAIAELQILTAPFDVRQSGFTGGVVNAVTKSGTNEWSGSAFAYLRDETFVGDLTILDVPRRPEELSDLYAGFTLGGPIVPDRLHLFAAAEFENRRQPPDGFHTGLDPTSVTGIAPDTLMRMIDLLSGYGVEAGETGTYTLDNDLANIFARIDVRIDDRNSAMLRYNFASADDDPPPNRLPGEAYELGSNATEVRSRNHSIVGQWLSDLGKGWSNDLLVNAQFLRDRETARSSAPRVEVDLTSIEDGAVFSRTVRAGSDLFAQPNELEQNIFQIANSLTWATGSHRLVLGGSLERFEIDRLYLPASLGTYRFRSVAELESNLPFRYDVNLYKGEGEPRARFDVHQWAAYIQDEWRVSEALNLQFGVRVDVPLVSDAPAVSGDLLGAFPIDTVTVPSGNPVFSPRFGFNLRLGEGTQLRGGAGLFAGRPPFAWLANAFLANGVSTVFVSCDARTDDTGAIITPAPAYDPAGAPPEACLPGTGPGLVPAPVNVFTDDFRFPQDYRVSLSIDQRLPLGLVGTLEGFYNRAVHQIALRDLNLAPPLTADEKLPEDGYTDGFGFGAREAFGEPTADGFEPGRVSDAFGSVIEIGNSSVNFAYGLSARLRRRFGDRASFEVGYAFNRSADAQSLFSIDATSNYGLTPVEGDPGNPQTQPSNFDRPHKVVASGSFRFLERFGGTEVSVVYVGQSGSPYSMVYLGDVNGDGLPGRGVTVDHTNDLIYVPRGPSDHPGLGVSSFLFESFVAAEPCLQRNRTAILSRNACRNAWTNQVDVRAAQTVRLGGVRAEVRLDLLNALNLVNSDWGRVDRTNSTIQIMRVVGRQAGSGLLLVSHNGPVDGSLTTGLRALRASVPSTPASQWQLQLGVRLGFGGGS